MGDVPSNAFAFVSGLVQHSVLKLAQGIFTGDVLALMSKQ
jgi:hypothetical protein